MSRTVKYYDLCVVTMLFLSIFVIDVIIYNPKSDLWTDQMVYGMKRGNNTGYQPILLGLCRKSKDCDNLLCSASVKYPMVGIEDYKCGSNSFPYTWLYIMTTIIIISSLIFVILDYVGCCIHSSNISLISLIMSSIFLILLRVCQTYYWSKVVQQEEIYTIFQCVMIVGQVLITVCIAFN